MGHEIPRGRIISKTTSQYTKCKGPKHLTQCFEPFSIKNAAQRTNLHTAITFANFPICKKYKYKLSWRHIPLPQLRQTFSSVSTIDIVYYFSGKLNRTLLFIFFVRSYQCEVYSLDSYFIAPSIRLSGSTFSMIQQMMISGMR